MNPASNPVGFTIAIVALTLVIVAASIVWRIKWQRGLLTGGLEGGTPATGIITGIGQTGTYINHQPRLTFTVQVQPATGGVPYAAEIKQTIPQAFLGMLAPGRPVALLVSPKDPGKVKLDLQGTAQIAGGGMASGMVGQAPGVFVPPPGMQPSTLGFSTPPPGAAAAAATFGTAAAGGAGGLGMPGAAIPGAVPPGGAVPGLGGPAQEGQVRSNDQLVTSVPAVPATVVAVQETGQSYGADPIVILDLQLQSGAGHRPLKAAYRVPAERRSRLAPGTVLRAHPDPTDPNAAGIDWRAL